MLDVTAATKILEKKFNNKRNLHRITTDQAKELNALIAEQDKKIQFMRHVMITIANKWYIKTFFPGIATQLRVIYKNIPFVHASIHDWRKEL
jgi:hypothetical protein